MKLQSHIIAGAVGTAIVYPFLGTEKSLLFYAASVLIDADHYLAYLVSTGGKDWSPRRMFRFYDHVTLHNKDKDNLGFSLMHTVEMFLVVYFLGQYVNPNFFMPIFYGMAYHMVFDIIWLSYHGVPTVRAFSIVEYFIRKHNLIKKGLDPRKFYKKMFELSQDTSEGK